MNQQSQFTAVWPGTNLLRGVYEASDDGKYTHCSANVRDLGYIGNLTVGRLLPDMLNRRIKHAHILNCKSEVNQVNRLKAGRQLHRIAGILVVERANQC